MPSKSSHDFAQQDLEHWWAWDATNQLFRHRLSGEELRYSGPIEVPGSPDSREWHRFDYVHEVEQVRYPLLVFTKTQSFPKRPNGIGLVERPLAIWRLDHLKSAELWQSERGMPTPVPPYGLWRRADDAFWGASLQFRPTTCLGQPLDMIAINGGWWNGGWRPEFFRRYYGDRLRFPLIDNISFDPRQDEGACARRHPIEEYSMVRMDAPPQHWTFTDMEVCIHKKPWPLKCDYAKRQCLTDETTGAVLHDFALGTDERVAEQRFASSEIWQLDLPGCPINIWLPPSVAHGAGRDFSALQDRRFAFYAGTSWDSNWFDTVRADLVAALVNRRFVLPGTEEVENAIAASRQSRNPEKPLFHPVYRLWSDMIRDAIPNVSATKLHASTADATKLWQAGTLVSNRVVVGGLDRFEMNLRLALRLQNDPEGDDWAELFA